MTFSRRQFMVGAASMAAAQQMGWLNALAATTGTLSGSDYRALVCVFLFGGNDANNMVIPNDAATYADYLKGRGALAIPQNTLLPLGNSNFALHPDVSALLPVWQQGNLAVQFNVGTLSQPLTKAQYGKPGATLPQNLFSHSDQQSQWQSAVNNAPVTTGWGGRMADLSNSTSVLSPSFSINGNQLYVNGARTAGLVLPQSGGLTLSGFGSNPATNPTYNALNRILGLPGASQSAAAGNVMRSALAAGSLVNPILSAKTAIDPLFSSLSGALAKELWQVARLIAARSQTGANRQVFFVGLGGFDTHTNQVAAQSALFKELGAGLKAFFDAMAQLGVGNQVTTFTMSDFARTFKPNSSGGTDHAWGSHHLILGGAVKGGKTYGQFPKLALGGPDDVTDEGRWIPTTSVDQYGATLARWFGVAPADLTSVFPNLNAFTSKDVGFMG